MPGGALGDAIGVGDADTGATGLMRAPSSDAGGGGAGGPPGAVNDAGTAPVIDRGRSIASG